jgi:hypothetical protein
MGLSATPRTRNPPEQITRLNHSGIPFSGHKNPQDERRFPVNMGEGNKKKDERIVQK